MSPLERFVHAVDSLNRWVGLAVSWLTLAMVLMAFVVVILRYVFAIGFVWMQELYVWLHGVVFMVGAGFTLLRDGHVRVDVIYRGRGARYRAWVDLLGSALLLLPVTIMVALVSRAFVLSSWERLEGSFEAGGLPGLFLLKTVIWVFSVLMALQGLSLAGRSVLALQGHPVFLSQAEAAGDATAEPPAPEAAR